MSCGQPPNIMADYGVGCDLSLDQYKPASGCPPSSSTERFEDGNGGADFHTQFESGLLLDDPSRTSAGVSKLDKEVSPYKEYLQSCKQFNCATHNVPLGHVENKCGSI